MKIIRFLDPQGNTHWGLAKPDLTVAERLSGSPFFEPLPQLQTGELLSVIQILAPLQPAAILGVGLNYRRHAEELGVSAPSYPVLFMKSVGSVIGLNSPICLPLQLPSEEVDYECELAIVIGKKCRNVTRAEALEVVLGYTCANDVSARDWQIKRGGSQWCRGKSFDTFCPLGPWIVTKDEISDPNDLAISTKLNGEIMQESTTKDMIFDVPTLIEFLSADTTLEAGTVILTGTPHGVGMGRKPPRFLRHGDVVTIEIERIGQLTNSVQG